MTVRARDVRYRAVLVSAVCLALALIGLDAQSQRTPGPPPDTVVDVLITFRTAPGQADEATVRGLGGTVRHRYRLVPGMAARLPASAVAALAANPRVALVEPDGQVFAIDHAAELANTWGVARIGAGEVHHAGQQGALVTVAVIDSGIDGNHPDLSLNYDNGRNFVNAALPPIDDNGHGTHVAGTVAAARDGLGVVGVAPRTRLRAVKVLDANGSGAWSNIIAALQYVVDEGILITNNSYGASSNPGTMVQNAFDVSAAAGVLHIAAAGNSGNCGGNNNSVGWPARYESVVAVAAVDSTDRRPCFSSTGPTLELSAPGVAIRSTIPGGGYASYNGTSMASPHVAGLAALLKGANGALTANELRTTLRATARALGNASHYGYGLIDAVAAIDAVRTSEPEPPAPPSEDPPPPAAGTVVVDDITYAWSGGPQRNRHLSVTVAVKDGDSLPVAGAAVSVRIVSNTNAVAQTTGTTGSNGTMTVTWNNAPGECYTTTVTQVSAGGLAWDENTPANGACR